MSDVMVKVGGVWEDSSWEVRFDVPTDTYRSVRDDDTVETEAARPCPHAFDIHDEEPTQGTHHYTDGSTHQITFTTTRWTVPRVAVAYNEAGHSTTGICLDCIVDWAVANERLEEMEP